MAVPASFDESNGTLSPPEGMTEDQVMSLSIARVHDGEFPLVVSCWKLSQEELDEINRTGRVWLGIIGHTMPPAWVTGTKPFP